MSLKDVLGPSLAGEKRVRVGEPVLRRIFNDRFYEIFVALYPGGLLATLVHYKRENLRIMSRLGEAPSLPIEREAWSNAAVEILKSAKQGPFHLVRDSKLECRTILTLHDRAALKMAGIEVPPSAGRFRDLFGEG